MQLKKQSVEAWSIIQKGIIPARTQSQDKPVDHVKYDGQVRLQHLLFVQFSP